MGLFEGKVWLKALFFVYFHINNFWGILDDFSNVFNLQQLRRMFQIWEKLENIGFRGCQKLKYEVNN